MTDSLLSTNDKMEALSRAYLAAISARAGYTTAVPDFDRDSVDMIIAAGGRLRPELHVQLKATTRARDNQSSFSFPLSIKNYNDLRAETLNPRILVVLALPEDEVEWLTVAVDQLVLKRAAYWISLKGAGATENESNISVPINTSGVFDVAALRECMQKIRTGASL